MYRLYIFKYFCPWVHELAIMNQPGLWFQQVISSDTSHWESVYIFFSWIAIEVFFFFWRQSTKPDTIILLHTCIQYTMCFKCDRPIKIELHVRIRIKALELFIAIVIQLNSSRLAWNKSCLFAVVSFVQS